MKKYILILLFALISTLSVIAQKTDGIAVRTTEMSTVDSNNKITDFKVNSTIGFSKDFVSVTNKYFDDIFIISKVEEDDSYNIWYHFCTDSEGNQIIVVTDLDNLIIYVQLYNLTIAFYPIKDYKNFKY